VARPDPDARPPGSGPRFYYDLFSPHAYVVAERLPSTPLAPSLDWQPIRARDLAPTADTLEAFRCAEEESIFRAELERRATAHGLQPIVWPDPFPFDSDLALRVATYAKTIGRVVAFSLAAFRQAFAAGHDLSQPNLVLIAAAACEMHPQAVLASADRASISRRLDEATEQARSRGVTDVPALELDGQVAVGSALVLRTLDEVGP